AARADVPSRACHGFWPGAAAGPAVELHWRSATRGRLPDGFSGARLRYVSSDAGRGGSRGRSQGRGGSALRVAADRGRLMNKRRFVASRAPAWRRFEVLLNRLDTISVRRFTAAETAEFSRLFRELCHDLSLIRSRDWGRGLISYLNDLVSRGHNAFYSSPPGNLSHLVRFLAVGFPRVFRKNIAYFLTACALFFGSLGVT